MSPAPTAAHAVAKAMLTTTCTPGQCLRYVRTWLGIPAHYVDAAQAWEQATAKHPGDRTPPVGAPVFYQGGKHGHIALYLGNGRIRTTDAPSSGRVSTQPLDWPEQAWGLSFAGWSEDLNTQTITYLEDDDVITDEDIQRIAKAVAPVVADLVWKEQIKDPDAGDKSTVTAATLLRRSASG